MATQSGFKLRIILLFLIFVKLATSQVTFPDSKVTEKETTTEATTEAEEEETEEFEETEETIVEEETTPGTNPVTSPFDDTSTQAPPSGQTTTQAPISGPITICAAAGQCADIDGKPQDDGSGKMDVRVNNRGRNNNTNIGTMTQITKPATPGITIATQSQTDCPNPQLTEHCILEFGYKCGISFQTPKSLPKLDYAAPYISYPWEGLVMRNDVEDKYTRYAAGALITHKHFITVANKVEKFVNAVFMIKVRLGEWNLASTVKPLPIFDFNVSSVNINPYYNNKTLTDNFAVITLSSSVPLGMYPHIGVACLPEDDITGSNIYCMVAGWGRESKVSDDNFVLKDVDQQLLNGTHCQDVLRTSVLGPNYELDTYSWICAGGEVNKSNCDGDGGNPLVCNITGQWYVVGLTSWGPMDQSCGAKALPELYVNVQNQLPYIRYVTQGLTGKLMTTRVPPTTAKDAATPSIGASTTPQKGGFTTPLKTKPGATSTTQKLAGSTKATTTTMKGSSTRGAFTTQAKTKKGTLTTKKVGRDEKKTKKPMKNKKTTRITTNKMAAAMTIIKNGTTTRVPFTTPSKKNGTTLNSIGLTGTSKLMANTTTMAKTTAKPNSTVKSAVKG